MKKTSGKTDMKGNHRPKRSSKHSSNSHSRTASSKSGNHRRASRSRLSDSWLKDFLSEMLAVEQGGEKLYDKAISELQHDKLRDKLEEFREETQRHAELVQEMMEVAGVESDYVSPGAEAAEHKAEGLLSTEVEEALQDLNNIENLVLAETKDHWNWEMLSSVAARIEEKELKDSVRRAVSEVFKQEREHLQWNQDTLTELATEMAEQKDSEEELDQEGAEQLERSSRDY
jgi:rubrerythrin